MSEKSKHKIMQIFDEDMVGWITLDEYMFALEAYNCRGGDHNPCEFDPDFVPYKLRSVYKLVRGYRDRNIDHDELFRMIDLNGNQQIEINELEECIKVFVEFKVKELACVHQYFDIGNNGIIDKATFINQLKKAERKLDNDQ